MKARDFAYWLQGYFEINGSASALTQVQAVQVFDKATSVTAGTDPVELKAQNFVSYTQGALSSVSYAAPTVDFLIAATADLKSKLNDLFIHAIDPSLPGDQAVNRQKHRPRLDDGRKGGLEAMC